MYDSILNVCEVTSVCSAQTEETSTCMWERFKHTMLMRVCVHVISYDTTELSSANAWQCHFTIDLDLINNAFLEYKCNVIMCVIII